MVNKNNVVVVVVVERVLIGDYHEHDCGATLEYPDTLRTCF